MFMPARALQTVGYARFDQPGVVKSYYVTPYIPGVDILGLSTAVETFAGSGASGLAASAVVFGLLATMF